MAVISVNQMWSRNSVSVSTGDRKTFTLNKKDGFQVIVEPGTSAGDILRHPEIPKAGQVDPQDPYVFAKSVTPSQFTPIYWVVDVEWGGEVGPNGIAESPLNKEPEISWGDSETDEEIDQDFDGNPICTACNEPIYGVTTKVADDVVTIKRNFLFFDPIVRRAYRRATNSDTFLGWPPGTARITQFNGRNVAASGEDPGYWEVTAQIQFREPYNTTAAKAWYARVRHEGFYVKEGSAIIRAVDDNKEPVTKPVLLKEDGTRETDPANAHWLEFKRYGSLPYNSLGLV